MAPCQDAAPYQDIAPYQDAEATPTGEPSGYDLAIPLVPEQADASMAGGAGTGAPTVGVLLLYSSDARQIGEQAFSAALDPASFAPFAFTPSAFLPFVFLADQLAALLEQLLLLSETRTSLRELEVRYRHYTGEVWRMSGDRAQQPARSWLRSPGAPADEQRESVETPRSDRPDKERCVDWEPIFAEARATGEPAMHLDGGQDVYLLAVPVKLRDVPIGAIGFHRDIVTGPWLPEQVASVQAVAERVALAAENLRLLDATQRRAAYDRMLAEVTARMRQSLDIDAVLQAGMREMRRALEVSEVELWLDVPEGHVPAGQEGQVEG